MDPISKKIAELVKKLSKYTVGCKWYLQLNQCTSEKVKDFFIKWRIQTFKLDKAFKIIL